jgi:CubicO group peptidase (beta-lactamase class C family)
VSALVLLAVLTGPIVRTARLMPVAVAHKAKMVCSGVFVSMRDPKDVLADLEIDDLEPLRYVSTSIDQAGRTVTTHVLWIVTRQAVYRDGLGCVLVSAGMQPRELGGGTHGGAGRRTEGAAREPLPAFEGGGSSRLDAVVDAAFTEPDPERKRRTRAVVVVHHGRVVAERYAHGIGHETPLIGWSMTKSVMNALVGILVKEGRLSLDAAVPVPEWQAPGDPRAAITLDHLLRMSSGLRFNEDPGNPSADVIRMLLHERDMASFAANRPLEAPPGTRWYYSSGSSNIISRVIRTVLNDDREYLAFPRRALFDRIGMSGAVLETDAAGTFAGSSYMYATARDWARVGLLYLRDGVWERERILPEGWVEYTRSPAPADPRKEYGAHFWLEVPEEFRGAAGMLPRDAFHMAGHEGQFVTIVPSRDTVIVRLGLARYRNAWDQAAFVRDVLAALDGTGS